MKLIAITGGIGCGKSVVARILARLGYDIYDCDSKAKLLMDNDTEIKAEIATKISRKAISPDGQILRGVLGEIVFSNPDKLSALNRITHASVKRDIKRWVAEHAADTTLFVETAILYQSGLDQMVDEIWEVVATEQLQCERVMKRSGCDLYQVKARIDSQRSTMPGNIRTSKRQPPTITILNDGTTPLLPQIEKLLSGLVRTAKPAAVLFDLDGVLIDSEGMYTECWDGINRAYPTGVPDFAHVIKGNTLEKILTTYFPPELHDDIVKLLDDFEREIRYQIFPGVMELLSKLKDCGIKTAVVTSSSDRKMHSLFAQIPGFRDLFDTIITGSDVTASKPDPQGYLLAAKRLGCIPSQCMVVEDSLQGLEAGRRSGATVVGIATTNPVSTIAPLSDITLHTVADLSAHI